MNADSAHSETEPMLGGERSALPPATVKAFLLLCVLTVVNQAIPFVSGQDWLVASAVVIGLVAAVASFAPVLPWPNVLLAAGLAAFVGGMTEAVSAVSGIPLGRREFMAGNGPIFLGLIPWWLPVIWATIALSSRGTARLILHGLRNHPFHGYRVIGLATALSLASAVFLEMFATRAAHLWTPSGTPVLKMASHLPLHLLVQIAITPLLIDKFPGQRLRNVLPLVVWTSFTLAMLAGIFLA